MNIPSFIEAYDKKTEKLIFRIHITNPNASKISEIFGRPLEDMQEGGFDISREQAAYLNKAFSLDLNVDKYDYQLDCDKRSY